MLSALKCFKYSACSAADVICERDDVVSGVDNPVPLCKVKRLSIQEEQEVTKNKERRASAKEIGMNLI